MISRLDMTFLVDRKVHVVGKADREHRAAFRRIAGRDLAAVRLDDPPANGQARANAGLLRAHIGVEDSVAQVLRNARPIVGDRDRDPRRRTIMRPSGRRFAVLGDALADAAAVIRMFPPWGRVSRALHKRLRKSWRSCSWSASIISGRSAKSQRICTLLLIGAGANQFQGLLNRLAHVPRPFLQRRRPGKIEERLDRTLQTRRLRFQDGQVAVGQSVGRQGETAG